VGKAVKTHRSYNGTLRAEQAQMTRRRILDAARRVLLTGTYSGVTMDDIAKEAGVAYQTVYAVFGTKQRLAQALMEVGFPHVEQALKLFDSLKESTDPELHLRTVARVHRLIYEPCADLLRFMRESGDPVLLDHYRKREEQRFVGISQQGLAVALEKSGRLRAGKSVKDALTTVWSWGSPDQYTNLVFDKAWTPDRYEEWLGDALVNTLLEAPRRARPTRA
jgi:TetR/AcrR family transcriptional regulator, regulator of autoinduction and epiphytic fitness